MFPLFFRVRPIVIDEIRNAECGSFEDLENGSWEISEGEEHIWTVLGRHLKKVEIRTARELASFDDAIECRMGWLCERLEDGDIETSEEVKSIIRSLDRLLGKTRTLRRDNKIPSIMDWAGG